MYFSSKLNCLAEIKVKMFVTNENTEGLLKSLTRAYERDTVSHLQMVSLYVPPRAWGDDLLPRVIEKSNQQYVALWLHQFHTQLNHVWNIYSLV